MINLIHGDCSIELKKLIDNGITVDLTVTSPPYDNLRSYNNSLEFNMDTFKKVAELLYQITMDNGIIVWVCNDATIDGSETGTSFKQALFFKEIGFNLHDTMIYAKNNPVPNAKTRYQQSFEYMFVLSKGKPKTTHILKEKRRNKWNDRRTYRKKNFNRDTDGNFSAATDYYIKENVPKRNIWYYSVGLNGSTKDKNAFQHPAIFPEKLVEDHVLSWSNEGDTVLDCFMGSGTTGIVSYDLNRNFIGIEKEEKYFNLAKSRIGEVSKQSKLW